MPNRLILLPGAAATGTDFLGSVLYALGCHVPQAAGAGPAAKDVPEPPWVVSFHEKLLRKAGVHDADARPAAWALAAAAAREAGHVSRLKRWLKSEFDLGDHVVIRESRLAWFIPAWITAGEAVAKPAFITVVRHPLEVLKADEEWHPNARVAGWINMALYTERATRGANRAIARHEDIAADALQEVTRLSQELDLDFVELASPLEMRAALGLEAPAPKTRPGWSAIEADDSLVELAEDTHATFEEAAGGTGIDDDKIQTKLDQLRARYLGLYGFVETTAQYSIAAGAGAAALGMPTYDPKRQEHPVKTGVKKLMRRTARTKEKAARRIRGTNPDQ